MLVCSGAIFLLKLPEDVHMMLALGPKFAVYQKKNEIPVSKIVADMEYILAAVENTEHHNTIRGKATNIMSNHFHKTNHQINNNQLRLHKAFINTKSFLRSHPNIVITAADKGNVTIVMEKTDYISLLTKHFQDEHKFRPLTCMIPPTFYKPKIIT